MKHGRIAWATLAIVVAIIAIVAIFASKAPQGEGSGNSAARGDRPTHAGSVASNAARTGGAGKKIPTTLGRVSLGTPSRAAHRPLPPPNRPLVEIRAELDERVREGDAAAACRLGYELDRCRKLPTLRAGPDFWREQLAKAPPANRESLQWLLGKSQQALDGAETVCAGLDPSTDTSLAWDYTLAAAQAGNREAIWNASFMPLGLDAGHPENTLEGWTQWRSAIPRILDLGLQGGDPRVFAIASRDYLRPTFGGRVFDRDPVMALALIVATEPAASQDYLPGVRRDEQYIIDSEKMTPQQVDAARGLAQSLPPVRVDGNGFDWSRGMNPDASGNDCERP